MIFSENTTKIEYKQFLNETINIFKHQDAKDDELRCIILEQLMDIKENIIELGVLTEWDDINERYTLGGIAVKNFDEDDELGLRIRDVFYGALEYNNFLE